MIVAFCIDESWQPNLLMIFSTTCFFSPAPYCFFFPKEIYSPLFFLTWHTSTSVLLWEAVHAGAGGDGWPLGSAGRSVLPKGWSRGQCCVVGRGMLLSFLQWGTTAFRETVQLGLKLKWAFCHSMVIPLGCPQGSLGLLPSACCRASRLMSARFEFVQHSLSAPESWPFVLQVRGAEDAWLHST